MNKLRKTLASLAPPPEEKNAALGGASPGTAPYKAKAAAAASPSDAMELRASHGDAMKALQGE